MRAVSRAWRAVPVAALLACGASAARAAPVTALAFSPDGSVLAAASGPSVKLISADAGRALGELDCGDARATALAFRPDGAWIAVGTGTPGESGRVRLLDWRQQKWLGMSAVAHGDVVTGVAFRSDGAILAVASADKSAGVYRVEDGGARLTPVAALAGHSAAVQAIAFSPDGQTIVTASVDRSLKVWTAADGRLVRSLGQHTAAVHALAFRPSAADRPGDVPPFCASGGDDRTVRVWQPAIGRMVRIVRRHEGPVLALAFTPDGTALFSAGREGIIRRIDADSDAILGEWPVSNDWIYSLAVSPDGRMLAAGDWTGAVRRWSIGPTEIEPLDGVADERTH